MCMYLDEARTLKARKKYAKTKTIRGFKVYRVDAGKLIAPSRGDLVSLKPAGKEHYSIVSDRRSIRIQKNEKHGRHTRIQNGIHVFFSKKRAIELQSYLISRHKGKPPEYAIIPEYTIVPIAGNVDDLVGCGEPTASTYRGDGVFKKISVKRKYVDLIKPEEQKEQNEQANSKRSV